MVEINVEVLTEDGGYVGKVIELDTDNDFGINEDDVDGELCRAGKLLVYYGDISATLRAQAARKKSALEAGDAASAISFRNEAAVNKEKITEGGIKEKVLTSTTHQINSKVLIETEKDAAKVENFFRSQKQKVDCLIALAYKQRTEIAKGAY